MKRQALFNPAFARDSVGPLQVEQVIIVKITSAKGGFTAEVVGTTYGKPTLNIHPNIDVALNFSGAGNKTVYTVAIDDPRVYYIDDGGDSQKRFDGVYQDTL